MHHVVRPGKFITNRGFRKRWPFGGFSAKTLGRIRIEKKYRITKEEATMMTRKKIILLYFVCFSFIVGAQKFSKKKLKK